MKSRWETHAGKKFLYCDYAGCGRDYELLRPEVEWVTETICKQPENSVLLLTDVRDSVGTREALDLLKRTAAQCRRYVRRHAVVGVTGIRMVLLQAVAAFSGQTLMPLDTPEKAKAWLTAD